MRFILYSLISLLLMVNFCFAGEREELQCKQLYLQQKLLNMELQFKLLPLEYPQVREELAKVTNQLNQLNQLQEKEKK